MQIDFSGVSVPTVTRPKSHYFFYYILKVLIKENFTAFSLFLITDKKL